MHVMAFIPPATPSQTTGFLGMLRRGQFRLKHKKWSPFRFEDRRVVVITKITLSCFAMSNSVSERLFTSFVVSSGVEVPGRAAAMDADTCRHF